MEELKVFSASDSRTLYGSNTKTNEIINAPISSRLETSPFGASVLILSGLPMIICILWLREDGFLEDLVFGDLFNWESGAFVEL